MRCVYPLIVVSGVRNSCDATERNSSFLRASSWTAEMSRMTSTAPTTPLLSIGAAPMERSRTLLFSMCRPRARESGAVAPRRARACGGASGAMGGIEPRTVGRRAENRVEGGRPLSHHLSQGLDLPLRLDLIRDVLDEDGQALGDAGETAPHGADDAVDVDRVVAGADFQLFIH